MRKCVCIDWLMRIEFSNIDVRFVSSFRAHSHHIIACISCQCILHDSWSNRYRKRTHAKRMIHVMQHDLRLFRVMHHAYTQFQQRNINACCFVVFVVRTNNAMCIDLSICCVCDLRHIMHAYAMHNAWRAQRAKYVRLTCKNACNARTRMRTHIHTRAHVQRVTTQNKTFCISSMHACMMHVYVCERMIMHDE